jgi:hypothetical protein
MYGKDTLGLVRVPLGSLVFPGVRQVDYRDVKRLQEIFKTTSCKSNEVENRIRAIVTELEFAGILQTLGRSREELQNTLQPGAEIPILTGRQVCCQEGKHRVAAAIAAAGKDQSICWIVELQCSRDRS